MPLIVTPHRWDYKPPPGSELDWSHPQAGPAGLRLCHLLNEGAGSPWDVARGSLATVTGAPTWTPSPPSYGPGRNGYGTAAYDVVDPPSQILGVTYPFWLAFGVVTTASTAQQYPGGQSSTSSNNPVAMIGVNQGSGGNTANSLAFFARGDNGTDASAYAASRSECTDAKYHVFAGVAISATSRQLWCDGQLVATAATTLGAMTAPKYTLGARRRTSVDLPFLGTVLWHQAGVGGVPDMEWLAREPFAAISPPTTRRAVAFGAGVTQSGTGVAIGRSDASGAGLSLAAAAGAATGSASGSASGASLASATGSAPGSASAAASSFSLVVAPAAATAGSAASATGSSLTVAAGVSSGLGLASAPGSSLVLVAGSAAGIGSALAASGAAGLASGSASGSSSGSAAGLSVAVVVASSAGSASATAAGLSSALTTASASGSAAATAIGSSRVAATGSAPGSSSASGTGSAVASGSGTATSGGSGTAWAAPLSLAVAPGSAAGVAIAAAGGRSLAVAAGSAWAASSCFAVVASATPPPSVPGDCPAVDAFAGSGDLALHLADTGQGWSIDQSTPSGSFAIASGSIAAGSSSLAAIAWTPDPLQEVIVSLTVTRGNSAGRLGPVVRLAGGVGCWGYYDASSNLWGLATLSGGVATVLATRPAGIAPGGSTALVAWASGRLLTLAADGQVVLMAVASLPAGPGGAGVYADSGSGCSGSSFAACYPRVAGRGGYLGGTPREVALYAASAIAARGIVPPSASFVSISPEPYPYGGLPMVAVRPGAASVDPALMAGMGRDYDSESFGLGFTVATQQFSDEGERDDLGLAGPASLDASCRSIFDALHLTWPRSPRGDYLTVEPLAMQGGVSPARPYRKVRSWRACDLQARSALAASLAPLD